MTYQIQEHSVQEEYQDLSNYVEDDARITPTTNIMKSIGPSIWIVEEEGEDAEQMQEETMNASFTTRVISNVSTLSSSADAFSWKSTAPGARHMVIVGLQGGGGAWVWNPQGIPSKELQVELQARCGGVKHLVSPNKYHVGKYLLDWSKAYPKAKVYAPPDYDFEGEAAKHADDGQAITSHSTKHLQNIPLTVDYILTENPRREYVLDIDQVIFRGSRTDEVVFFHRLSNTVLFCDLLQQVLPQDNSSGANAWLSSILETVAPIANMPGAPQPPSSSTMQYPYMVPYTWQLSFWWKGEQELAGKAFKKIQERWNPQQIVMSRGEIVKEDAPQVLTQSFAWVPPLPDVQEEPKIEREALGRFIRGTFTTGPSEGPNEGESTIMKDKEGMPKPTPVPIEFFEEKPLAEATPVAEESKEMAKPPPTRAEPTQDAGSELFGSEGLNEGESTIMKDKEEKPNPTPAPNELFEEKPLAETIPVTEGSEEMAKPAPARAEPTQDAGSELFG